MTETHLDGTAPDPRNVDKSTGAAGVGTAIRNLDPAYFGFIMSTGIISIAFRGLGIDTVGMSLAVLNVACFLLLLGLFGIRFAFFPRELLADMWDNDRRWGTLTFVVGTNTVGAQLVSFLTRLRPRPCYGCLQPSRRRFYCTRCL